ncbi:hypothetical protein M0R04_16490, partial [Candidatus Dojkabacteria bacterium]|nr:hypothetical protein [Candidatus Dojkabacteria bacterium]
MANEIGGFWDDCWNTKWSDNLMYLVGNYGGASTGAFHFSSIGIAKNTTVFSALLNIYVAAKGPGSGNLEIKTYGFDVDNLDFFTSNPTGQEKTTAVTTQSVSVPSAGNYFATNVKDQVNEILSRAGWSSGNALGFVVDDNGSNSDVYVYDTYLTAASYLAILVTENPDFTPGPYSTNARIYSEQEKYGIRISKPGKDVTKN